MRQSTCSDLVTGSPSLDIAADGVGGRGGSRSSRVAGLRLLTRSGGRLAHRWMFSLLAVLVVAVPSAEAKAVAEEAADWILASGGAVVGS